MWNISNRIQTKSYGLWFAIVLIWIEFLQTLQNSPALDFTLVQHIIQLVRFIPFLSFSKNDEKKKSDFLSDLHDHKWCASKYCWIQHTISIATLYSVDFLAFYGNISFRKVCGSCVRVKWREFQRAQQHKKIVQFCEKGTIAAVFFLSVFHHRNYTRSMQRVAVFVHAVSIVNVNALTSKVILTVFI